MILCHRPGYSAPLTGHPSLITQALSFHIDAHSAPVTPLFLTDSSKTPGGGRATDLFPRLSFASSWTYALIPSARSPLFGAPNFFGACAAAPRAAAMRTSEPHNGGPAGHYLSEAHWSSSFLAVSCRLLAVACDRPRDPGHFLFLHPRPGWPYHPGRYNVNWLSA